MAKMSAEEHKELGNAAFAKREYNEAIDHYSRAIEADENEHHVYHSNRSACYASLQQWEASAEDARVCVARNPSFVKGYYRLATAETEMGRYEEAIATLKRGLGVDPENAQLKKLQKAVRARQKQQSRQQKQQQQPQPSGTLPDASSFAAGGGGGAHNKEVYDLQQQYVETSRTYNITKADIAKSQREQKINKLTLAELDNLLQSEEKENNDDTAPKLYRGVGKMFMLSDHDEVMTCLNQSMDQEKKREIELTSKLDYLERRMKNQSNNIRELYKAGS